MAVRRLLHPTDVRNVGWVTAAGVIGFAGNELVAVYRIRVGRNIGSAALVADGLHARTDGLTSLAVVVGAVGAALGFRLADPLVGLAITVAILFVLKDAARDINRRLMDSVDPDLVDHVERVLSAVPGVEQVEAVRLRWVGHELRAEAEVVSDCDLTLARAHDIAEEAHHRLLHQIPAWPRPSSTPARATTAASTTMPRHPTTSGLANDRGRKPMTAPAGNRPTTARCRPVGQARRRQTAGAGHLGLEALFGAWNTREASLGEDADSGRGHHHAVAASSSSGFNIAAQRYHRWMVTSQVASAELAARLFRGFADQTRIAILMTLLGGERRVSDLVEAVGGSQSNVSGHLACLRDCGLVVDRPGERRQVFYRLAQPEVVDLLRAAERLFAATGTAIELCRNPLMDPRPRDG